MTVRVFFQKLNRAKYISHLDVNRCMQRALKRSGLPVWHTQGFNPHIFVTFALPLSLGCESTCESMDFKLEADEYDMAQVVSKLNLALPEDLKALRAAIPVMKSEAIVWADYSVYLFCDGVSSADLHALWQNYCNQQEIMVDKKSKKGIKQVDLKPLFEVKDCQQSDKGITLNMTIAAGGTININPSLLFSDFATQNNLTLSQFLVTRTAIYDEKMQEFC